MLETTSLRDQIGEAVARVLAEPKVPVNPEGLTRLLGAVLDAAVRPHGAIGRFKVRVETAQRMTIVQKGSLAGRALNLVGEMQEQGRMTTAEAQTLADILWHSELPDFFRSDESAPQLPRNEREVRLDHR